MKAVLKRGGQEAANRPSGYSMTEGSFSNDNGGAILGNLVVAANTESNSDYIRGAKAAGFRCILPSSRPLSRRCSSSF